jgi:CheY-like chemotaxis protein
MVEYRATSDDAKVLHAAYDAFVKAIRNKMDPHSNTVLVVDDERGIRRKVERDVKAFDPTVVVIEAVNGKDALEKLAHIRTTYLRDPLLIVLDLNMPVMDGWQVIDALKKDYERNGQDAGIPIIVLSSTSGEKNFALVMKKSVHDGKSGYTPLVSIAKEACTKTSSYDAAGSEGLLSWLEFFIKG